MRIAAVLLIAITITAPTNARGANSQVVKLYPIDQASRNPDLFMMRARLLRAVVARDTAILHLTLAPGIVNSFDGDGGLAEFKSKWKPELSDSDIWPVLADVLSMGGTFEDDTTFIAPYTNSTFPKGLDAFEHLVVIASNVLVRTEPNDRAPPIARLAFDVVSAPPSAGNVAVPGFVAVRLAGGRLGYVDVAYVKSPLGYRARFVRIGRRWLLKSLVAGD